MLGIFRLSMWSTLTLCSTRPSRALSCLLLSEVILSIATSRLNGDSLSLVQSHWGSGRAPPVMPTLTRCHSPSLSPISSLSRHSSEFSAKLLSPSKLWLQVSSAPRAALGSMLAKTAPHPVLQSQPLCLEWACSSPWTPEGSQITGPGRMVVTALPAKPGLDPGSQK